MNLVISIFLCYMIYFGQALEDPHLQDDLAFDANRENRQNKDETCPKPFKKIGSEYLYFHDSSKMHWYDALSHCKSLGGSLAEPANMDDFITLIETSYSHMKTDVWLGATDSNIEGDWKWLSGGSVPSSIWPVGAFPVGQPDGDGDCMQIIYHGWGGFFVNDNNCKRQGYFVCECTPQVTTEIDPYIEPKCCNYSTTDKCSRKGTDGFEGYCMPKNETCLGNEFSGKKYCVISKYHSCKCCVPTDCSRQVLDPCKTLNGTCIGIDEHCNGKSVVSEDFCKKDAKIDTCKCCIPQEDCPSCGEDHDKLCAGLYQHGHDLEGKQGYGHCMKDCDKYHTELVDHTCSKTEGNQCKCCKLNNDCGPRCESPNLYDCLCAYPSCPEGYCQTPYPTLTDACPEGSCSCCKEKASECPNGCFGVGSQCFLELPTYTSDWNKAGEMCHEQGQILAEPQYPQAFAQYITENSEYFQEINIADYGGIAKASSNHFSGNHDAVNAFGDSGYWRSGTPAHPYTVPQSLWVEFNAATKIVKYSFTSQPAEQVIEEGPYVIEEGPSKYIFWASNYHDCSEEAHWVILKEDNSGTAFTSENIPKEEVIENVNFYRCYGFKVIDVPGHTIYAYVGKPVSIANVHFYSLSDDQTYWIGARGTNNENAAWVSGAVIGPNAPWVHNWYDFCKYPGDCLFIQANQGCYASDQCFRCWFCHGDEVPYPTRRPLCTCNKN